MQALTIGQLAKESGVNLETVRYYERRGLLPKPPRSASAYRLFPAEATRRLRFIQRAKELGFSLKEIRELLSLLASPRMSITKRKVEIFSAGCSTCKETIELVKRLAGSSHDVEVHDMNKSEVASRARQGWERANSHPHRRVPLRSRSSCKTTTFAATIAG